MPDVSCQYTLAPPSSGTIVFNDGSADQFYIAEIPTGLAGSLITGPRDPVPFQNDVISYAPFARGRDIHIEGIFLITSTRVMNSILTIRNQMEDDLRNCLELLQGTTAGTLTFQPLGQASVTCSVRATSTPLECVHDQGYLVRTFSFGLWCDTSLIYA